MSVTDRHGTWARYYDEVNHRCFGVAYDNLTAQTLSLVGELSDIARIVDFGAGTGRLALPLAEQGYAVTAVEPSRPMLAQLAAKDVGNRVAKQNATMAECVIEQQQDLAIAVFTVIAYIRTPRELMASFANVAAALRPGGFFLVDVPGRVLFQGVRVESKGFARRTQFVPTTRSRYRYHEEARMETSAGVVEYEDDCELRYWSPRELRTAFQRCGFEWHRDVSARFPMAGAAYWLLRRLEA